MTQLASLTAFIENNLPARARIPFTSDMDDITLLPFTKSLGHGQLCTQVRKYTAFLRWDAWPYRQLHPGGFEPPTARFVAEYSIQLSYGCIGKFILLLILIPPLKPYQVRKSILTIITDDYGEYGASGRIRTSDRSVRSRVLYPAELRMHREIYFRVMAFSALRSFLCESGIFRCATSSSNTSRIPQARSRGVSPSNNPGHQGFRVFTASSSVGRFR